jgi:hypothetical protein
MTSTGIFIESEPVPVPQGRCVVVCRGETGLSSSARGCEYPPRSVFMHKSYSETSGLEYLFPHTQ